MTDDRCKHCGGTIRLINFALGESWQHVGNGGFNDHWLYCKLNVATPADPPEPPPAPWKLCHCDEEPKGPHVHKYADCIPFLSCQPDGCEFVGGPTRCWADHK